MIKKVIVAISIILIILLSTTSYLYADSNSNGNNRTFHNRTYHFVNNNNGFRIRARSNNGGTISPEGITQVASGGSSPVYTITANSGYELSWLKVDGNIVANQTTYQFTNVTSNHTIEAHFVNVNSGFKIISVSNNGGTISPEGIQTVAVAVVPHIP